MRGPFFVLTSYFSNFFSSLLIFCFYLSLDLSHFVCVWQEWSGVERGMGEEKKGGWQAMDIRASPAVGATETRDELKRNHEDDALNADAGVGCGGVEDFALAEEQEEEGWCMPHGTAEDKKAGQGLP
ncbi:hypothetical protein TcCL_NonESM09318 [Trypanosoma cruzi]|nr:hypothetical protein TcCL_NonESM09318 [Trypanosoma cruzi]